MRVIGSVDDDDANDDDSDDERVSGGDEWKFADELSCPVTANSVIRSSRNSSKFHHLFSRSGVKKL
jgi:hypothetical protein